MRQAMSIPRMALAGLMCFGPLSSFAEDVQPIRIALAQFDFADTSGEIQDQTAKHERQLRQFEAGLRKVLSDDDRVKLVTVPCGSQRCSLDDPGVDELKKQARAANARYLLAGGIHKMSTLIGWMKFIVFDLDNDGRVCDRLLTYRGDTDEAWRRAAEFGARNVMKACFSDRP